MNTNTLSPESSSASSQQQGLAGKGKNSKEGQTSTLFSRLLESLQQGSKGKKGVASKEAVAESEQTKTAVPNQGKNKTVIVQTAAAATTNKTVIIATTEKKEAHTEQVKSQQTAQASASLKAMVAHQKGTLEVEAQTDVVATAQEAHLIPQQAVKTGTQEKGESQLLTQAKNKQGQTPTTHVNNMPTQVQVAQPSASKGTQTPSHEQPTVNNASSSASTRPPAELDAKVSTTTTASSNPAAAAKTNVQSDDVISQLNAGKTTSNTRMQSELNSQPTVAAHAEKAAVQQQSQTRVITNEPEKNIAQLKNSTTSDSNVESKDPLKAAQSPAAALQQRSPNQAQNHSHLVSAQQSGATVNTRISDSSFSSSQQDLNSSQQQTDATLLDASKSDLKTSKGLDFQAQLAYKSQRTFTPGDTMLEIVRSAKTGATSLELQLEPANLGKVQVSIQMDAAKQIQVMFTVDQANSRHALEQQMPQLRLAMAQQGLDLGGFSMQMNQQGDQQAHGQSGEGANATNGNINPTAGINAEQQTRLGVNMASHGHLSVLA